MRSLSQLNTRGQTTLNYTDLRAAQVVFDRVTPISQTQNIPSRIFAVLPGIEITEIVQPNVVNVYYEVNVSSVSGATVAWAGVPGTVTISNPSTGIYRATNIDSAADWAAVRAPTITLPVGYSDEFTYTTTIYYEPSKTKVTSVGVVFQTFLNSQFNITASITGIQQSFISAAAIASINIKAGKREVGAAAVSANALLAATGRYAVGRLRSVISSTAAVSATSTRRRAATANLTAVNTLACSPRVIYLHQGQAAITATSSITADATIVKGLISTTLSSSPSTLSATTNDIILAVTTSSAISVSNQLFGYVRETFRASGTWPVRDLFAVPSAEGVRVRLNTTTEADLIVDVGSDAESLGTFTGNSDLSRLAFSAYDQFGGDGYGSDIYFFDRSGTTWTRTNKFTTTTPWAYDNDIGMSRNGQFLAHAYSTNPSSPYGGKIDIYEYSTGSWAQINNITLSGEQLSDPTVRISDDGNYVFLKYNSNITKVYFRSSGTYTLQQTITNGSTSNEGLAITAAGDYFVIGDIGGTDNNIIPRTLGQSTTLVGGVQTAPTVLDGIPTTSQLSVNGGIVVNSTAGFTASGYIQIGDEVFSYSGITSASNRFDGVNRDMGIYPATTHSAGASVRQVVNPITYPITTPGKIMVYKRTGTTWALEQTLRSEGIWTNEFGYWIEIDGTIDNIQILANSGSGFRYIKFTRI